MRKIKIPLLLIALFAGLFFILSTSFSAPKARPVAHKDTNYYWYLDNGTVYDGWRSTNQEIARLEAIYNVYVDTDPFGGTLIASGYSIYGYPHVVYASVLLYSH